MIIPQKEINKIASAQREYDNMTPEEPQECPNCEEYLTDDKCDCGWEYDDSGQFDTQDEKDEYDAQWESEQRDIND